ncbi:alkaline phosphatase family protein [Rhizobium jaguaris]|uniref:Alkaline phosphatase family protein n=1 Tax=Rhizobium jaguaris TaxID=1312183 RepID=A0A387G7V1_9HYPH|nr:alkaline phosphatase family protein [Rhizobium jaguaris]AYG63942.1 alkaline phosphatase family protein [Rhizobium jaguaris]
MMKPDASTHVSPLTIPAVTHQPVPSKAIVILVDGVSADYFVKHRYRLPTLSRLAGEGLSVERLRPTMPGTSMPGRASMMTGAEPQVNGIYGNHIVKDGSFICADAQYMRVPTIAKLATNSGLDVASIGAGLVDPADCNIFVPAWWERGFLQGSRFFKSLPEDRLGRARIIKDPEGRLAAAGVLDLFGFPAARNTVPSTPLMAGLAADHLMVNAAGALACSDNPPDLILTEIEMTDAIQHQFGYESEAAHWSISMADLMIGALVDGLRRVGRESDYAIVVASDHGHSAVHTALYPQAILPDHIWESEGATLHVLVDGSRDRTTVDQLLGQHKVEAWSSDHVPVAERALVATYVAPPGFSFEETPLGTTAQTPTGKPQYASTHGFRPGSIEDDRMCLFGLGGIEPRRLAGSSAEAFAPTVAQILGLSSASFAARGLL